MEDCLFCRIIEGKIPSTRVYEDENCYAFKDINPQAPVHIVLVPKTHVCNIGEAAQLSDDKIAAVIRAVGKIAAQEGLTGGYRVVSNCGRDACQSVEHWHVHILGGTQMADKMV